jgi:hypothetical protein
MSFRIGEACALLLAMTLGACATTPTHVALSPAAQANIASTEVVAPILQSEIYVYVPPTTAGQGNGLIGALIDAGVDRYRAGTAERDIKGLRDTLVDLDFDRDLKSQLQTSLSKIVWLHLDGVRVVKELTVKGLSDDITGSKDSAVIIAIADYHLSNDGSQLVITANLDLHANSPALAPFKPAGAKADGPVYASSNSLYRNHFTFQCTLHDVGKRDVNMAAWSANNGAAIQSAMKLGVAKIGDMIALDLQGGEVDLSANDPNGAMARLDDGSLLYTAK